MIWPLKPRQPLTLAQLAVETLLTKLVDLPVAQSVVLADRAGDGFGGLLVKRHSRHTLAFQRTSFQGRSRWGDGPDEARVEFEAYVASGKIEEPDRINGW
jgi:hypothetical protein